MKRSNIPLAHWEASFTLPDTSISILSPKVKPEAKPAPAKKSYQPESAKSFTERTYDLRLVSKGVSYFGPWYSKKIIDWLHNPHRNGVRHLFLMGEIDQGQSVLGCAIAKEVLQAGFSVYFSRTKTLLKDFIENADATWKKVAESDLLILDRLGFEYHTDSQYALKQLQEIIQLRQDAQLPMILITSFFPNEIEEFYKSSFLQFLHHHSVMAMLSRDESALLESSRVAVDELFDEKE
jgi:hypothetical protein